MKLCDFFKICPLVNENKCISQDGRDEQSCFKYWEHKQEERRRHQEEDVESRR